MGESTEESERVSVQISSLSTQLIESIERQSVLEEKLNQARRTIQGQRSIVEKHESLQKKYNELESKHVTQTEELSKLNEDLVKEKELRAAAQKTVEELNTEIEDLTASLFDEANKMVATARKEGHAIEVKNTKLIEQLREKDSILEILNLQLKNLKKVLQNVDQENTAARTPTLGNEGSESSISLNKTPTANSNKTTEQLSGPIYSPNIASVRYDLQLYKEFVKFLAVLPHCETLKETSSHSKLIRRLINDEIQPILRLDNASGLGWIVRRTIMSLMMAGLVVVEPLSGLNETFQYGSPSLKSSGFRPTNLSSAKESHLFNFPSDSPPIAVHDKCSFCSEDRDDVLEHARMYVLKTQNRLDDGSLVVTNSFPLCRYCLLKIRQTCEIFAFLRSLKLGAWNLEKVALTNTTKDEGRTPIDQSNNKATLKTEEKASHRLSVMGSSSKIEPQLDTAVDQAGSPTTNIQRAWLQLCKLRSTLHWTHIGIWSVDDSIGQKISPLVRSSDENDDTRESTSLTAEEKDLVLGKLDSEDFVLKKGDDEEPAENETFDFESKDVAASVKNEALSNVENPDNTSAVSVADESSKSDVGAGTLEPDTSQKGSIDINQGESLHAAKKPYADDQKDNEPSSLSDDKPSPQQNHLTMSQREKIEGKSKTATDKDKPEANDTDSNAEEDAFDDAIDGESSK